jgi:Phosphate-selective porin O and P
MIRLYPALLRLASAGVSALFVMLGRITTTGAQTLGPNDAPALSSSDGTFRMRPEGRLQVSLSMFNRSGVVAHRFELPTARIGFSGHVFSTYKYELSGDFGSNNVNSPFELRDAYIDSPLLGLRVRLGQFKRFYSQGHMRSLSKMQFTERAITDAFSGAGRDIGVSLYDRPARDASGWEWGLGVYNGRGGLGSPEFFARGAQPQASFRAGYTSARLDADDEADFDGGPFRVGASLNYLGSYAQGDTKQIHQFIGVEGMLKAYGTTLSWSAFSALYTPPLGKLRVDVAGHVQAGHMVVPNRLEFAARYGQAPIGDVWRRQATGAANIYVRGHRLKVQVEGGVMPMDKAPRLDWLARVQMQLVL